MKKLIPYERQNRKWLLMVTQPAKNTGNTILWYATVQLRVINTSYPTGFLAGLKMIMCNN